MITIRTGGNGSYKSAHVVWFEVLRELKNGRVVVTNLEGMQPLHIIEERLDIKFPETAKLIRIFSRDEDGLYLWRHFFCWCPLNALIVIDECQDIYSKNIGFDGRKIEYKPLEHFLHLLPKDYESFFNSRHVPVDMSRLEPNEVDDRGKAEYDENGRIIYPLTYNEGFTRHRKYNWDIVILSPDWTQIEQNVKSCAEQCFYHKNNDGFLFNSRKPYIYKHDKSVTKPKIPEKAKGDPNLFKEKIPVEVHLLYKSTGTGKATKSGGTNTLFKSPKFLAVLIIMILCWGYLFYAGINYLIGDEGTPSETQATQQTQVPDTQTTDQVSQTSQVSNYVHNGGDSAAHSVQAINGFVPVNQLVYFPHELKKLYFGGFHRTRKQTQEHYYTNNLDIVINAYTPEGVFPIDKDYLKLVGVEYEILDECLLKLTNGQNSALITCEPYNSEPYEEEQEEKQTTDVESLIKENQVFL